MDQRTFRLHLGKRIVAARLRKGWNQDQLAKHLQVPQARLKKWEGGYTAPRPEDLVVLSEALEVTVDHLLIGRRSVRPPDGLTAEAKAPLAEYLASVLDLLK